MAECNYVCDDCHAEDCIERTHTDEELEQIEAESWDYIKRYDKYFEDHGDVPVVD